jgi:hypothetical protein
MDFQLISPSETVLVIVSNRVYATSDSVVERIR